MIRPEHPFDIRPDLHMAASTTAESVIRPKQLVRIVSTKNECLVCSVLQSATLRPFEFFIKRLSNRVLTEVELRKCCLGQSEKSESPYYLIIFVIGLQHGGCQYF